MWPILAKIGASLLFQLITETFAKEFAAIALTWAAKQSHTDVDDKMVEQIKLAWKLKS